MGAPVTVGYHWYASGVPCACGDCERSRQGITTIPYDVGVVQGKGVQPYINEENSIVEYLDWLDDEGQPYVNVVYMCNPSNTELEQHMAEHYDEGITECFTSLFDDVTDTLDDHLPRSKDGELMSCDACGSSIVAYEPIILMTHGRLVLPDRRPAGTTPVRFQEDAGMIENVMCLECAKVANMLRTPHIWGGRLYSV